MRRGGSGCLHVAFPLKMMRHPDGRVTSCDLLHTLAGAVIFDMFENQDARLISIQMPDEVIRTFPGPAYGPINIRKKTGFALDQPAFGTILKPTAGITPEDVERLVGEVAGSPLLMFIKEDEDLYPDLDYSPVAERTKRAIAAIERVRDQRGGLGLVYSPHVSAGPGTDRRAGAGRRRSGCLGGDVQRDLRRGNGPDGPRGDQARSRIRRRSTAITPASASRRAASGAR